MNQTTNLVADTICRTVELGVTITGAAIGETITHIDCRPVEHDPACPTCGQSGRLRDHVTRVLADLPIVGHPTRLHVRLPRFTCSDPGCGVSVFRQRIDRVAAPKASITRRTTRWILHCLAVEKMSVSAVAKALGVGWDVVNSLALSTVRELAYNQPGHLDGVRILGVDEHKWKHVRGQGDPSFVTVIVDLTPVIDGTGPARLLDMVAGRSAAALTRWLTARDQAFRDRVKIVAMDGFAGYHSAAKEGLPQARTVMDPFHVVHLAAEKLTVCRQRVQQITLGHRGRSGDPLYGIKRVLLTRKILRTDKQKARLEAVFADEQHIDVEVTEHIYQDLVALHVTALEAGALWTDLDTYETGLTEDPNASTLSIHNAVEEGRSTAASREDIAARYAVTVEADTAPAHAALHAQGPDFVRHAVTELVTLVRTRGNPDAELAARVGLCATISPTARDALLFTANGNEHAAAHAFATIARQVRGNARIQILTVAAYCSYISGDGPSTGIALEAAQAAVIDGNGEHDTPLRNLLDFALEHAVSPTAVTTQLHAIGAEAARSFGVDVDNLDS